MKTLRITALFMLVICLFAFAFASCEQLEEVKDKIPFLTEEEEPTTTHEHTFKDATCTAPKTCECGATEGEAAGHDWAEATCAVAKTCKTCNEVSGLPVGHNWVEATCTERKYCTSCDKAVGSFAPHLNDIVSDAVAPTCTESGLTKGVKCSACGTVTTEQTVVPATGHTFIDGECACGAIYEGSTVTTAWLLSTELKNGDLVLIGAPAYGKLLSAEKVDANSYYNKGVDYSADNFANVTDAEIFVVTINDDGSYTFTSLTGKVIALAASYSSLNEDGANKTWTLVSNGDGTFLMKNIGRNTYLEWYSSKNNWSTYTAGNTDEYYLSFYVMTTVVGEDHVHNHTSDAVDPTCTEPGYTTYTCACGDTYTVEGDAATGHSHEAVVTDPTCTEPGYTTHTCSCGDTYTTEGEAATGHSYSEGTCTKCGGEDPEYHVHDYNYSVTTTATCTADGVTTYTCSCGDYRTEDTAKFGHVDANLDVECDRSGCTSKIAPAADSVLSTFTANNLGSKLSTSNKYYVVGTIVEVLDQKNGIFLVDDGTGETFYFRLPKNAEGVSHSSWEIKLTLGDKVQIYGAINKYSSSSAPNGQYWPAMQSPVVTLLEQHAHAFVGPTCTDQAYCVCGQLGDVALGHLDTDASGYCDRCNWDMSLKLSSIAVSTTVEKTNGVLDEGKTSWTWSDDEFNVVIAKGTSTVTLYTTAKDYMQLKKLNTLTVSSKNGATMKTITIGVTSTTYLTNIQAAIGTQHAYTVDEANLTVTIVWNSAETFTFSNQGSNTVYINSVEVVYAPATNA